MADLKSVLEGEEESAMPESETPSYDTFATKIQELLGLDEEKAQELRDVICGLAAEEMSKTSDSEESVKPSMGEKKKPALDIIIGMGSKPKK